MVNSMMRLPIVLQERGRSRSAHYLDIQQGVCTKPVSLGARSVGWPAAEIAALNAARIAGKSDDEIRELVRDLESKRGGVK